MARSRSYFSLTASAVAGVTTEALLTTQMQRDGVNGSSATSHAITTGKVMRIHTFIMSIRTGAAAIHFGRVVLRHNPSGAATATSPIIAVAEASSPVATSGATGQAMIHIPEGVELRSGQIGVSHIETATTTLVTVSVIGYEY